MPKFHETDKFKRIEKTWAAKLKKSGFEDIEQADGNMKVWHSRLFMNSYNVNIRESKETYYRLTSQFLNDHVFESKLEYTIWAHHCEGRGRREITRLIRTKEHKVRKILDKLINLMKTTVRPSTND